jgi:hypothetical protein
MDKHDWITQDILRKHFRYDAETGLFTRLRADGKPCKGVVGTSHRLGYRVIGIARKLYYAHRLAWMYVHGEWPGTELDHINGVRDDNRIENLRRVTRQENMQNLARKRRTANPTSQYLGVSRDPRMRSRPWRAMVNKDGKNHDCGYWATEEEAHAAYVAKKREIHSGCTL